jgi:endonuclease YncB( thermonuclease family)
LIILLAHISLKILPRFSSADVGEQLVKEGMCALDPTQFTPNSLFMTKRPAIAAKYQTAEHSARKCQVGLWKNIPFQRNLLAEGSQIARHTFGSVSRLLNSVQTMAKRLV